MSKAPVEAVRLRFWGVRSERCTPGRGFTGMGGNTICTEVQWGADSVFLEAGSGFRAACENRILEGKRGSTRLLSLLPGVEAMEGLRGLSEEQTQELRLYLGDVQAERWNLWQRHPVLAGAIPSVLESRTLQMAEGSEGKAGLKLLQGRHARPYGCELHVAGRTIAYLPNPSFALECADWQGRSPQDQVDVLLLGGRYSDGEPRKTDALAGGTYDQCFRLIQEQNAAAAYILLHSPERCDEALEEIEEALRQRLRRAGMHTQLYLARESGVHTIYSLSQIA